VRLLDSLLHKVSMTFIRSSVGILLYIFEMSSEAIFNSETKGISDKSLISCTEFWTLYTFGSGIYDFKIPVNNLANL